MGCIASKDDDELKTTNAEDKSKVVQDDAEWRKKLTTEQYRVLRKKGTEAPWTGKLLENKAKGVYQCAACGADLFSSATKYDSGSGWPSFMDSLKDQENEKSKAVNFTSDYSNGMRRTEVTCAKCDSHLGHMFRDGPGETGERYCINSVSLQFKNESKKD